MAVFGKRRVRDRASGPTTLIAAGCVFNGEVSGSSDILLSGTIIGDSRVEGVVTITEEGIWRGGLQARDVVISGKVEGDVIASGHIEITATARISGTVTGDMIAVAAGAVIEGDMRITGQSGTAKSFEERRSGPSLVAAETKKAS